MGRSLQEPVERHLQDTLIYSYLYDITYFN